MTDNNDWRVTISLPDQAHVERAQRSFSEHEVEEDVRRRLGRNVAVGVGDSQIFLYAGTETAATEAERVARDVLAHHDIQAEFALHRWHPIEEQWENPDVAMPQTEAERQAEHQRLVDAETAESLASGIGRWQARVECPSHREAVALASKLRSEGRAVCDAGNSWSSVLTTRTKPGNSPNRLGGRLRPTLRSASRNPAKWAGCSCHRDRHKSTGTVTATSPPVPDAGSCSSLGQEPA